ncbi:MAG: EVE domain-containing protein [SAR202 cluster bacterium Io17-Chloro-G4]|nr:MAG: EVE domain-containing protein [SAR202 cluster bacterium Io17-Chloro-G4]
MAEKRYWLFKSEPTAYSYADLQGETGGIAEWDGVRNYQARNLIRDEMKSGDGVLFYHSSANPMAVIGTALIVKNAYPDATAWDPNDKHYDPKSTPGNTVWMVVDIQADQEFPKQVTLQEIKDNPKLQNMMVARRGMRLSVQPVTAEEWAEVLLMGGLS